MKLIVSTLWPGPDNYFSTCTFLHRDIPFLQSRNPNISTRQFYFWLAHDFENWPSYNAALVSIDFTSHHSVFRSLCSCSVPFRSLWLHVVWWRSCDVKWYGSNYFLLHSIWTQRCPGDIRKLPIPSFVHGSLNRASGRSHLHLLHTPPWGLQNSDKNLPSSWDSVTTM